MLPIELRLERPADYRAVEELTRDAFWNHHVPGCDEHYLAHILRDSPDFVPELDYVAVHDGQVVGNIMYTRAKIVLDRGGGREVLCFGPLAVAPAFQGQGVGGRLVEHTKALARELGYAAILILGDPDYYSRFGFVPAERYGIGTSWGVYIISLQAFELQPDALADCAGYFEESSSFRMEAEDAVAFDAGFPPKEKLSGLPSQEKFQWIVSQTKPRRPAGQ
ncbi:MAG: N-acetyltransferase [Oscillospiraceae bacterium]|nr:N-acetyltransferase [Oscillospiraceae bacterium]